MSNSIQLLFIIAIAASSCQANKKQYFDKICDAPPYEGELRDFQKHMDSVMELTNEFLNIKPISKQPDTFYLRVTYSSDAKFKILEYSYFDAKEAFKLYSFPTAGYEILFNKNLNNINDFTKIFDAKQKGKEFFNVLKTNHILELGDTLKFKDYTAEQYPFGIVEISNKCRHEFLTITDVPSYKEQFVKAKYVSNFLSYLRTEFKM
jgi:hypothetical protein